MTRTKKIAIGAGGGALVLALAGLALANNNERGVEVRTEAVGRRNLVSVVTASGRIDPKRKVDISADISGRVVALAVQEGQTVSQGDLLLRIDPTAYQAQVRRAEASVAQAQATAAQSRAALLQARSEAERAQRLAGSEELMISAAELDKARTGVATAEAQYEAARYGVQQALAALSEARDALGKTTIVAPMSGRVTRLNIDEGETAVVGTMNNPGSLLLTIADLSVMEAVVKVDETDVPAITIGDSAVVRIDAFPDRTFAGRVTRIANSSLQNPEAAAAASAGGNVPQSVDFEVVITLDNPPAELRPDLSATAEIVTASRGNALAVPIISLTVRDSAGGKLNAAPEDEEEADPAQAGPARPVREVEGVFVVAEDGKAKFVPVHVGIAGDQYFEVLRGLRGGETVVSGSYQAIRDLEDGAAVKTPEPEAGDEGEET